MERRLFFKRMAQAAAALTVGAVVGKAEAADPDLALWAPGAKTHFLPPANGGWKPNFPATNVLPQPITDAMAKAIAAPLPPGILGDAGLHAKAMQDYREACMFAGGAQAQAHYLEGMVREMIRLAPKAPWPPPDNDQKVTLVNQKDMALLQDLGVVESNYNGQPIRLGGMKVMVSSAVKDDEILIVSGDSAYKVKV